jgi:hypothetical protein
MIGSTFRIPHSAFRIGKGQATLELTAALIGMLVLLFGSLKICFWVGERFVKRQQAYEATRVAAGSDTAPGRVWNEPSDELHIFGSEQ